MDDLLQLLKAVQEALRAGRDREEVNAAIFEITGGAMTSPADIARAISSRGIDEGKVKYAERDESAASDFFRMLAHGASFGFSDELVGLFGGDTQASRERLATIRGADPVAAGLAELAGGMALPSSAALMGIKGAGAGASLGRQALGGAKMGAAAGALEGALYGAGEGQGVGGRALGAAIGAPFGAAAGGLFGAGLPYAGEAGKRGLRMLRELGEEGFAQLGGGGGARLLAAPENYKAAIKVGKRVFQGNTHVEAREKAWRAGAIPDKWISEFNPQYDLSEGFAEEGIGFVTRMQSMEKYGIRTSEDLEAMRTLRVKLNIARQQGINGTEARALREDFGIDLRDDGTFAIGERVYTQGKEGRWEAGPSPTAEGRRPKPEITAPEPAGADDVTLMPGRVVRSNSATGGATFDPRTGKDLGDSNLYAVSPFKAREEVLDHIPTADEIRDYIARNQDLFDQEGTAIGTWENNGRWYLDVTRTTDDADQAARWAAATEQHGYTKLNREEGFPTTRLTPEQRDPLDAAVTRWEMVETDPVFRAGVESDMLDNLLPHEVKEYNRSGKNKGAWLKSYVMSPTPREWASLIELGYNARNFYPLSKQVISSFGKDAPRFTAFLSALSPQRGVEENLKLATRLWSEWEQLGRPTSKDRLAAWFHPDDTTQQNAIRALQMSEKDLLDPKLLEEGGHLSGLKVDAFYSNLMGNVQRVTLDTHMARGVGIEPKAFVKYRNRPVSASIRAGTKYYNAHSGRPPITPEAAQAATWAPIRAMTETAGKRAPKMEAAPSVQSEYFDFPVGPNEITQRIPREMEELGGWSFWDVLNADPAQREAFIRATGGVEPEMPIRAPMEDVRMAGEPGTHRFGVREQDIESFARRIDRSRWDDPLFQYLLMAGGAGAAGAAAQPTSLFDLWSAQGQ